MKEIATFPKRAYILSGEPIRFFPAATPNLAALAALSPSATPSKPSPSASTADDDKTAAEMFATADRLNLSRVANGNGKYAGLAKAELKKRADEDGALLALLSESPTDSVQRFAARGGSSAELARAELAARGKAKPTTLSLSSPASSTADDSEAMAGMLADAPTESITRLAAGGGVHADAAREELCRRAREHPGMNVLVPRGRLLRCRAENQDASATTFFGATK